MILELQAQNQAVEKLAVWYQVKKNLCNFSKLKLIMNYYLFIGRRKYGMRKLKKKLKVNLLFKK